MGCVLSRCATLAALLAGCAPRRVDPAYHSAVVAEALAAAARDHACPAADVRLRCDATPGEPDWEVELDVCGHVRRYRRDDAGAFGEVAPTCAGAGHCASSVPACTPTAPRTWWAIETTAPEACDDAEVDPALGVTVDGDYLGVALANPSIHPAVLDLGASCRHPSIELDIDGQWYALCGGDVAVPDLLEPHATLAIQPGLVVAPGRHDVSAVRIAASGRACVRSRVVAIDVAFPAPLPAAAYR